MYHDTAFSFPFAALSEWRAVAVITWSLIMAQHYARARVFYSMIASRIALRGNFSIIYGNISISIFNFSLLKRVMNCITYEFEYLVSFHTKFNLQGCALII